VNAIFRNLSHLKLRQPLALQSQTTHVSFLSAIAGFSVASLFTGLAPIDSFKVQVIDL
jgi:hypothetical protein